MNGRQAERKLSALLLRSHREYGRAPSLHLRAGIVRFLVEIGLRGEQNDGHAPLDERERAVLQFSRRAGLREEIADLLELERALARGGKILSFSEEEKRL